MQYVPRYCKQESRIHKCTLKSNNSQPFDGAVDFIFPDNIPLLRTSKPIIYLLSVLMGNVLAMIKPVSVGSVGLLMVLCASSHFRGTH